MTNKIKNPLLMAGIGEVLWDVVADSETLGGAPVNFAYHARQLGAKSWALSSIGGDARGERALSTLKRYGVATDHITEVAGAPTGYVIAEVDQDGVATYNFPDEVAWDHIQIEPQTMALAAKLDAICFGSLAQRSEQSRMAIQSCLQSMQPAALKIFDLNIRQNFYSAPIIRDSLAQADILKLNDDEIVLIAELEGLKGDQEQQLRHLVERYHLLLAVLTRGADGSLMVSPQSISDHPGFQTEIVDTIGAGDSFTAVTAVGMLKGYSLETINEHAGRVAAYVCSKEGAMVQLPAELSLF